MLFCRLVQSGQVAPPDRLLLPVEASPDDGGQGRLQGVTFSRGGDLLGNESVSGFSVPLEHLLVLALEAVVASPLLVEVAVNVDWTSRACSTVPQRFHY